MSAMICPHACAVFVKVVESHMTFIACHRALMAYSTIYSHTVTSGIFHCAKSIRMYYRTKGMALELRVSSLLLN